MPYFRKECVVPRAILYFLPGEPECKDRPVTLLVEMGTKPCRLLLLPLVRPLIPLRFLGRSVGTPGARFLELPPGPIGIFSIFVSIGGNSANLPMRSKDFKSKLST